MVIISVLLAYLVLSAIYLSQPRAEAGSKAALVLNRGLKGVIFLPVLILAIYVGDKIWPFVGGFLALAFIMAMFGLLRKGASEYSKGVKAVRVSAIASCILFASAAFAGKIWEFTQNAQGALSSIAAVPSIPAEWTDWLGSEQLGSLIAETWSLDHFPIVAFGTVILSLIMLYVTKRKRMDLGKVKPDSVDAGPALRLDREVADREYEISIAAFLLAMTYTIGVFSLVIAPFAVIAAIWVLWKVVREPALPKNSAKTYRGALKKTSESYA